MEDLNVKLRRPPVAVRSGVTVARDRAFCIIIHCCSPHRDASEVMVYHDGAINQN
jgi:hypothetical protein